MKPEQRILIVDDDDAIRTLIATVLQRRGLAVDVARNGIDAVAMLADSKYAVVLLDLMMPLMSGYEVLDYIAARDGARPLVIVLTAGLAARTFDASIVVGTIHKPFDVELLVDTVVGCMKLVSPPAARPEPLIPPRESRPADREEAN